MRSGLGRTASRERECGELRPHPTILPRGIVRRYVVLADPSAAAVPGDPGDRSLRGHGHRRVPRRRGPRCSSSLSARRQSRRVAARRGAGPGHRARPLDRRAHASRDEALPVGARPSQQLPRSARPADRKGDRDPRARELDRRGAAVSRRADAVARHLGVVGDLRAAPRRPRPPLPAVDTVGIRARPRFRRAREVDRQPRRPDRGALRDQLLEPALHRRRAGPARPLVSEPAVPRGVATAALDDVVRVLDALELKAVRGRRAACRFVLRVALPLGAQVAEREHVLEQHLGHLARHAGALRDRPVPDAAELDLQVRRRVRDQVHHADRSALRAHDKRPAIGRRLLRREPRAQPARLGERPTRHVLPDPLVRIVRRLPGNRRAARDLVQRLHVAIEIQRLDDGELAGQRHRIRLDRQRMASRQDLGWVHGQIVARLDGGCLASGVFRNALLCLLILTSVAVADDTSATDKLRILYSTRFTFTDDGLPLVTVQIMGGKREVKLHAKGGVMVRPDGAGGAAVEADGDGWTISVEGAKPAQIQEWTVVETLGPDDQTGINAALARRKDRGFDPRVFEIGSVFGTGGEAIDTREVRIAVDPVAAGKGSARAADIAKRYAVKTSVHEELVKRPSGTIVARSGSTVIKTPSVIWFQPKQPTETLVVAAVPTGTGGSQLETGVEARRYWGSVYVTLDHAGSLIAA